MSNAKRDRTAPAAALPAVLLGGALLAAPAAAQTISKPVLQDASTGPLDAGESTTIQASVPSGNAVGFTFEADFSESDPGSWASDMSMRIDLGDGNVYQIGGLSPDTVGSDQPWSFQGSFSDAPGTYSHDGANAFAEVFGGPVPKPGDGTVEITFTNTWQNATGPISYDDISLTLLNARSCDPLEVGAVDVPAVEVDVVLNDDLALVPTGDAVGTDPAGLRLVDVSDPANPTVVGEVETTSEANGVGFAGDFAFVAVGGDGLQVVDVAPPDSPSLEELVDTPGFAQDADAINAFIAAVVFVADDDGGVHVVNYPSPSILGTVDLPDLANSVEARNEDGDFRAYVATGAKPGANEGALRVIDATDQENPTLEGSAMLEEQAVDVALQGDHAYVADTLASLKVVDVSDPANPTVVGTASDPEITDTASGVAVSDGLAVITGAQIFPEGPIFQIYDVRDPANPIHLRTVFTVFGNALGAAIDGDLAYIAGGPTGLDVYDLAPCRAGVPADLNDDGDVDGTDLGMLISAWGPCDTGAPCPPDFTGDGTVNATDLGVLIGAWGPVN